MDNLVRRQAEPARRGLEREGRTGVWGGLCEHARQLDYVDRIPFVLRLREGTGVIREELAYPIYNQLVERIQATSTPAGLGAVQLLPERIVRGLHARALQEGPEEVGGLVGPPSGGGAEEDLEISRRFLHSLVRTCERILFRSLPTTLMRTRPSIRGTAFCLIFIHLFWSRGFHPIQIFSHLRLGLVEYMFRGLVTVQQNYRLHQGGHISLCLSF
mmetsp:Transcript_10492/g.30880  ORF Transcript_10492/g.30880 Transcript_10492/m.30880 type:complete len:215 (+) Transcript_10492:491-1135(+)